MTQTKLSEILVLLAFVLLGSGCLPSLGDSVIRRPNEPDIFTVDSEDPAMNDAVQKARDTVRMFLENLKSPKLNQTAFSIKMNFKEGAHSEHMWLNKVSYDGSMFEGVIANEPLFITKVKLGDKAKVAPKEISDWMFIENGKLVGGFTVRVLRDRMSPEERKRFDSELRYTIEDFQK